MSADAIQRLVYDLEVHQIELELQNEELRTTQMELSSSRDRYTDLYEFAPVGYLTLDSDMRIVEGNLTATSMLGVERSQLVGKLFSSIVSPKSADDLHRHMCALQDDCQKYTGELLLRCGKGASFPAQLEFVRTVSAADNVETFRCIIVDISERKQDELEICRLNAALEATLAERTSELQASDEMLREIGNELHDDLGQVLHGVHFLASELRARMEQKGMPESVEIAKISNALEGALSSVRGLARGLLPVAALPEGLENSLREHAANVSELYGVDCSFVCPKRVEVNDPKVATHLFRIAQEAVNNAVKHSKCKWISIWLKSENECLVLSVRDDGIGINAADSATTGAGLRVMQFRSQAIKGSLQVKPLAEGGTELVCSVELKSIRQQTPSP